MLKTRASSTLEYFQDFRVCYGFLLEMPVEALVMSTHNIYECFIRNKNNSNKKNNAVLFFCFGKKEPYIWVILT